MQKGFSRLYLEVISHLQNEASVTDIFYLLLHFSSLIKL